MADSHSLRSAEHYREQASNLRRLAAREPEGSDVKAQLLKLAVEYDLLVARAQ
jgi:hypothetical protein